MAPGRAIRERGCGARSLSHGGRSDAADQRQRSRFPAAGGGAHCRLAHGTASSRSLTVADFNPDAGTVAIRQSKTGKPRHVVLTDEGAALFARVCAGRAGSDAIFPKASGGRWLKSHQKRPMAAACERASIKPPASFHTLRHTWASLAVMNGVPLLVVAKNLGHSRHAHGREALRAISRHLTSSMRSAPARRGLARR